MVLVVLVYSWVSIEVQNLDLVVGDCMKVLLVVAEAYMQVCMQASLAFVVEAYMLAWLVGVAYKLA